MVSLNGVDPIDGTDDVSLQSLGIVPGDMLSVLSSPAVTRRTKPPIQEERVVSSSQAGVSSPIQVKDSALSSQIAVSSQANMSSQREIKDSSSASKTQSLESKNKDICRSTSQAQKIINKNKDPSREGLADPEIDDGRSNLLEAKDGQPSATLEKIFSEYTPESASQAVNLLVHLIMLECKFHTENTSGPPVGWREMVATFHYNSSFLDFKCTLVLVSMGEVKQILASFPQQESEISVRLKVGEYVKDSSCTPILASNLIHVAQLARTLRDNLLHPLHVAAHEALGVPAPWHLVGLPHELLLIIAYKLEYRCVLDLGQTCHHLHSVMNDNKLWQMLFKRDFNEFYGRFSNQKNVDWKLEYKSAVKRHKIWGQMGNEEMEFVIPGVFPPSPFVPRYPGGPYPYLPQPRGPNPYPPQPHPQPNPFFDPDSPYFSGEIPRMPGTFPEVPDPLGPLGPMNPLGPMSPLGPFMPARPRNPRGPRFDFF